MNLEVLGFSHFGAVMKKQVSFVLIVMSVILVLPCLAVYSMGESAMQFLAAAPSAEIAETQGFYMGGPIRGDTYEWGNCTYWVYAMRLWAGRQIGGFWGNANAWDESAINEGYVIDHFPAVGAIFQTDEGQWGHVAYVTAVDPATGRWTISEMNAPRLNVVSSRTFAAGSAVLYDFIHDKKGASQ
jgi:surface antigen